MHGNRSRPFEQIGSGIAYVMGLEAGGQVGQFVNSALAAGGDYAHCAFQKLASRFALHAKAQLAFDHAAAKPPLGRIVGRFDAFDFNERPQSIKVLPDMPT